MIRSINESDLPKLRQWKNDHRDTFFFKDEISEEQQIEWYHAYQERQKDFMFMVLSEYVSIGCMAIRLIDDSGNFGRKPSWDIYNVILGLPNHGKKGIMSDALKSVIQFALPIHLAPVRAKVLNGNPALDWYRKNKFAVTYRDSDHYVLTYQGDDT